MERFNSSTEYCLHQRVHNLCIITYFMCVFEKVVQSYFGIEIRSCLIKNKSSAAAEMDDRVHNRHRSKRGGCCAPFAGGGVRAGSPSNTMSPGLRPTSVPSGILMHPVVWPQ